MTCSDRFTVPDLIFVPEPCGAHGVLEMLVDRVCRVRGLLPCVCPRGSSADRSGGGSPGGRRATGGEWRTCGGSGEEREAKIAVCEEFAGL
jgi:hypothetical protein